MKSSVYGTGSTAVVWTVSDYQGQLDSGLVFYGKLSVLRGGIACAGSNCSEDSTVVLLAVRKGHPCWFLGEPNFVGGLIWAARRGEFEAEAGVA